MFIVRKLSELIANAKFRLKLFVSYFMLVSFIIVILGFAYYQISARNMIMNVKESLGNVVSNNNQLLDEKLQSIRDKSDVLPIDKELYQVLVEMDPADKESLIKADRRITQLLFQYFGGAGGDDTFGSFILTPHYSFGSGARMYVPPDGFFRSILYHESVKARGDLVWIPTYPFAETLGEKGLEGMDFEYSRLISAVKELNLTYIDDDGVFHALPQDMVRPVLMVNLTTEDVEKLFADYVRESKLPNLSYGIISPDGKVVIQSVDSEVDTRSASQDPPEWLKEAAGLGHGSFEKVIDGRNMLVSFDRLESTGWISYIEIPVKDGLQGLAAMKSYSVLFLGAMLAVSALLAYLMSVLITKPIIRIKKAMKLLERGNFQVHIPERNRDELGQLIHMFNNMSGRIQTLIEENYASRLREKEAELMALNLQLNPHFLYNTLTTMYWIAIENNQQEISRIMRSLAEMLQTSTRNKSETWPLSTDLDWMEKYIYIMSSRFEDQFTVRFDIEEELKDMEVPKLFLQPFVENAIIHGFAEMEEGGEIEIKGWSTKEKVIFSVTDNGAGFSKEKQARLQAGEVQSTGMPNVDKRIKLLYGEGHGIEIFSIEGEGTRVLVYLGARSGSKDRSQAI